MALKFSGTVGKNGAANKPADVDLASKMLWANGYDVPITSKINNKLIGAIIKAQKAAKAPEPHGTLSPGEKTIKTLATKYTAEARRIANSPKYYEINYNNKCYRVSQKEYDEQKVRALGLLAKYASGMRTSLEKFDSGHDALLKVRHGQQGFMSWVAMSMVHVAYNIDYPKPKHRYTAQKAAKAFESAVKMKDFKKIGTTMPAAEKAATAWAAEFNRWWKEASGSEEKMQWWIATGKTTGWIAVSFFLAPAGTAIAGAWGGAVLTAGMTGQAKYMVDNLDSFVSGSPTAALKTTALSNVAAAQEMSKAAAGGLIGGGVKMFGPAITTRLMARFPSLTKPVATAWTGRVLGSCSALIDSFVADGIDAMANKVIGKGGKPEKPKSFQEKVADKIWTVLLAGAVGELDEAFKKKWDPETSPVTIDFFATAAERQLGHKKMAENQVKAWRSRLGTSAAKGSAGGLKGEVMNLVVSKATGKEKSAQLIKMADKAFSAHPATKKLVESIVSADAAAMQR